MSNEKIYTLVESTSTGVVPVNDFTTDASPYINLISDKCTGYTAANKIEGHNYVYTNAYTRKHNSQYDDIYIAYDAKYSCNGIPLNNLNTYDNTYIKSSRVVDVQNVNVSNPIISIEDYIVKYYKIPNEISEDYTSSAKKIYTIKKREYNGAENKFIDNWSNVKGKQENKLMVNYYTNSNRTFFADNPNNYYMIPDDLDIDYDSNINILLTLTRDQNPNLKMNYFNMLKCDEGDFISGWSYKTSKKNGSNMVSVIPKCIHYYYTSSLESIAPVTCPADGDWPVTNTGRTASKSCPTGYAGTVTRVCSDGQWKEPVSNCSKIAEITYCPAVASTATTLAWPKTEQSKTATQKCPSGYTGTVTRVCNADGTWNTEQRKCTEETVFDKLNNLGSISIGGTDIYLWYIIIAFIVFIVLLLIIKVKSKKEDPMEKIWKMRMMGF